MEEKYEFVCSFEAAEPHKMVYKINGLLGKYGVEHVAKVKGFWRKYVYLEYTTTIAQNNIVRPLIDELVFGAEKD